MKKGWHVVTTEEILQQHNLDLPFRNDPDGLCRAVGKELNSMLAGDPYMNGWQWAIDWHNLPGAISVAVSGTACAAEEWDCPAFFAATSVATYEEVPEAAKRLRDRIHYTLDAWKLKNAPPR